MELPYTKTCSVCSKKFRVDIPEWVYKTNNHKFQCSWTCYRIEEKKNEKRELYKKFE